MDKRYFFWFLFSMMLKLDAHETKDKKPKNPYFTKFQNEAHLRPTKCQVCRLLVTEFLEKMKATNNKEAIHTSYAMDLSENNKIDYQKSEIRLMEVLDGLCNRMKLYQARAGPEFPYIKGVVSHLREVFEDMSQKSHVKLKFELPEEIVDDYTYEITRVKFECIHLMERVEELLEEWYFKHQDKDLMNWLCAEKILSHEDRACLTASTEMPSDYYAVYNTKENADKTASDTPASGTSL